MTSDDRPPSVPQTTRSRVYLIVELIAVFIVLPAVLALHAWSGLLPGLRLPLIPMIWLVTAGCLWWLLRQRDFDKRRFALGPNHNFRRHLPGMPGMPGMPGVLIRFLILGVLLTLVVHQFAPDIFLSFPRRNPRFWLLVMVAYPILSVYPQGIVWRGFILHRYRPLFGSGIVMLLVAAALFSFGHIVLRNPVALALTFVGGLLFVRTYQRTGSLLLAAIEHALYGDLAFTLGLGYYLYRPI